MSTMTKSEREDLQRLVRQRDKVQRSAAKQRSAQLLADFENQMGSVYRPEDDPIWTEVMRAAEREVEKAKKQVAARCRELGIPDGFAPTLHVSWTHRGYNNLLEKRRAELRRMAQSAIEALEREAILQIEVASLESQTELALEGLTSEAARAFIERLPTVESLMPPLSFEEVSGETNPPIAEQLVSPNTLRQRRFRERHREGNQAALHNGNGNASLPLHNGDNGGGQP